MDSPTNPGDGDTIRDPANADDRASVDVRNA
jgi:hypothetical protein